MNAQDLFDHACATIPALKRLSRIPETEKGEGTLWVSDHVVALLDRISTIHPVYRDSEERDPIARLAVADAVRAVTSSPATFRAYALMHDIAKPDRLLLVADAGSVGEAEGFVRSEKRAEKYTTESELIRFDKMRRAGAIDGVHATFDGADRAVIAPQYAEIREAIVKYCGLETAHVKFVAELCWSHKDIIDLFQNPGNESAFSIFPARAGKAGLNVERFLDSLFAIAWLEGGEEAVHRLASAENVAMPERHEARVARERHNKKVRIKEIFGEAGLDPEKLFVELNVPFGPVRGQVMESVYEVIRGNHHVAEAFGASAESIRERAHRAAEILAKEGLSV